PPRYAQPRYLHSFPTRRSSDLFALLIASVSSSLLYTLKSFRLNLATKVGESTGFTKQGNFISSSIRSSKRSSFTFNVSGTLIPRSEEHTSELQSRLAIVCRLLR